ncbi:hypothetical protein F4677DRAFT_366844 [Hypoxylon crocopeplum]|nr:hypothetical protein F4677DRAFT_366844 [Hypoxylon crocopeplum]
MSGDNSTQLALGLPLWCRLSVLAYSSPPYSVLWDARGYSSHLTVHCQRGCFSYSITTLLRQNPLSVQALGHS